MDNRQTVGDVRGQSLGEYWPYDLVGIQEGWVVVDLTKEINQQIATARKSPSGTIYPYGKAGEAEKELKRRKAGRPPSIDLGEYTYRAAGKETTYQLSASQESGDFGGLHITFKAQYGPQLHEYDTGSAILTDEGYSIYVYGATAVAAARYFAREYHTLAR